MECGQISKGGHTVLLHPGSHLYFQEFPPGNGRTQTARYIKLCRASRKAADSTLSYPRTAVHGHHPLGTHRVDHHGHRVRGSFCGLADPAHAGKWNDARENGDEIIPLEVFGFICEIEQERGQADKVEEEDSYAVDPKAHITDVRLTPVSSVENANCIIGGTSLISVQSAHPLKTHPAHRPPSASPPHLLSDKDL